MMPAQSSHRMNRLLRLAPVDGAVGYALLARVWMLGSNALTMLLIVHVFSEAQQGLYFTFLTLLGLHAVFDFGVSFSVTQWAARSGAVLDEPLTGQSRLAAGPGAQALARMGAHAWQLTAALGAVFLLVALGLGLWLFAIDTRVARSEWLVPWILASLFTALRIPLLAVEGLLEGLGKVGTVARVRLAGLVAGTLALWALVACGAGLHGLAASCALSVLVPGLAYARRYGWLLRGVLRSGADEPFAWRRAIWPFQWRYAASVLAGVLVVNLFNPAIYYYRGAEAAGRFGLGMSIAQAVAGFMSVWLNARVPLITRLTAERRHDELRALFRSVLHSAAAVALLAGAAAMALVALLALVDVALARRIAPPGTLLVLLAAAVTQQAILTVAAFARAQAREPLLLPSLLAACATSVLLAALVPRLGPFGAALAYLLPVLLVALPFAIATHRQVACAIGAPVTSRVGRWRRFRHGLRVAYSLGHWRGQLALARIVARPGLAGLALRRPRLLFKYLHTRYLIIGLDSASRLAILSHHYARLAQALPAAHLRALLGEGLLAWQSPDAGTASITLSFPRHDLEGELLLTLWAGGVPVYSLTATLAPGDALGLAPGPVLLLTCLQGVPGLLPLLRQTARACAGTAPPYLLLAAAGGLAEALGAERIAAAGNARQLAKAAGRARFDYDGFWLVRGGEPTGTGLYLLPTQLPEQPLQSIPARRRRRQALRREFRRAIAQSLVRCLGRDPALRPATTD